MKPHQPELPFLKPPCDHESGFVTHACVPCGVVCCDCNVLILQYLPSAPDSIVARETPGGIEWDTLGYVTADWAWHYRHGRPWTTL